MPEMNPFAAEAIRNIKSGRAAYQKTRDFQQRAVVGGIQAGLMGGAGLLGWAQNRADERRARQESQHSMGDDVQRAIAQIAKSEGRRADNTSGGDRVAPPTSMVDPYQAPVFTGAGAEPLAQEQPLHTKAFAKDVLSGIDNSDAGVAVPYAGTWNRRDFDKTEEEAGLLARDIGLAQTIINSQRGLSRGF